MWSQSQRRPTRPLQRRMLLALAPPGSLLWAVRVSFRFVFSKAFPEFYLFSVAFLFFPVCEFLFPFASLDFLLVEILPHFCFRFCRLPG
eukprot:m.448962 g.448962  ORF g.448962 m.448962 type:complete len:89 (+) comp56894_c0_seq4:900-1166(+)